MSSDGRMNGTQDAMPSLPARYYEVCDAIARYVEQGGSDATSRCTHDVENSSTLCQAVTSSTTDEPTTAVNTLPTTPSGAIVRCVERSRTRKRIDADNTRRKGHQRVHHTAAAAESVKVQTFDMEAAYRAMRMRVERDVQASQSQSHDS